MEGKVGRRVVGRASRRLILRDDKNYLVHMLMVTDEASASLATKKRRVTCLNWLDVDANAAAC